MGYYNNSESAVEAIKLLNTALESGSIKLIGSHSNKEQAEKHASADAAYLSKLIEDLTAGIGKVG